MSDAGTPLPHPLCVHLCSKKLYMLDMEREVVLEDLQTAGYENYWCLHTSTDNGPDGGWVLYDRCAPGRPCYEPVEQSVGLGRRIQQARPREAVDWSAVLQEAAPPPAAEAEELKTLSFTELLRRRTTQER
jgi:hypothetical protein